MDIQETLNKAFMGVGRVQAAIVRVQNQYDDVTESHIPDVEELEQMRAAAYNARLLAEKMAEFMINTERAIEDRMKTTGVADVR